MLPIKTTFDDIEVLTKYLRIQVGWVELEKIRKTIKPIYADNRKIEAMRYLGLLDRDGANVKLSELGRKFAGASDEVAREAVLRPQLRSIPLYHSTLEWIYHQKNTAPTKTEIANYWHDNQSDLIDGAAGAALTDGTIFFVRVAAAAGLGQFIGKGNNRPDTCLKVDESALAEYVTGTTPVETTLAPPVTPPIDPPSPKVNPRGVEVTASPGVHINIEIHVAADAKPSTVEEIFKNMRKYVLDVPDSTNVN